MAVFANVTAAIASDPAEVQRLLVEQVTGRVRWRESVIAMQSAGVDQFVELGGKVLGPMIGRCVADVAVSSVVSMNDIEALWRLNLILFPRQWVITNRHFIIHPSNIDIKTV